MQRHFEVSSPTDLFPVSMSIANAVRWSGICRTEIYNLIGEGKLKAVKNGRRTLIVTESLRSHIHSLPAAKIGASHLAPRCVICDDQEVLVCDHYNRVSDARRPPTSLLF